MTADESNALRIFEEVVDGQTIYSDGAHAAVPAVKGKKGKVLKPAIPAVPPTPVVITKSDAHLDWLNAYNAPHWIGFNQPGLTQLTGWTIPNGTVSLFGTSWVFDPIFPS